MSARSRLVTIVLATIVLGGLIAAGLTAYWFHAAGEVRKGIQTVAAQYRAAGWIVELDSVALGGFPLAVTVRLDGVELRSPAGLSWHGEAVALTLPLLHPRDVTVDMAGQHILAGFGWSGILTAGTARAELRLGSRGDLAGLAVTASALVLEQPATEPLTLAGLCLAFDRLDSPAPGPLMPSAGLTLALRGLGLPHDAGLPLARSPLARSIDGVQVEARVMGAIAAGPPLPALAAWRDGGGTIALDRIALDWQPLALEADGTLALDAALQPQLTARARIRGAGELVVRLVQAGLVEPDMAAAVQVMLAIWTRPDSQGRPTLPVPLTLRDGILSAGTIRVMRLPPLPIPPPL